MQFPRAQTSSFFSPAAQENSPLLVTREVPSCAALYHEWKALCAARACAEQFEPMCATEWKAPLRKQMLLRWFFFEGGCYVFSSSCLRNLDEEQCGDRFWNRAKVDDFHICKELKTMTTFVQYAGSPREIGFKSFQVLNVVWSHHLPKRIPWFCPDLQEHFS